MKLTKTELHALIKEALDESHSKADEKKLKKISKQLKGSSKMHAAQADDIDDIVDRSDDEELKEENIEEGVNCGCGNTPCSTYGKVSRQQLSVMIKEEYQAVLAEKKKRRRSPPRIK